MGERIGKSTRILIGVFIALLLLAGATMANYSSFLKLRQVILGQVMDNQLIETTHVAAEIEDHVKQVRDELVTLTKFPIITALGGQNCGEGLVQVHGKLSGKLDSLLRIDRNGTFVDCSAPMYESLIGINVESKDYFRVPKETSEPYVSGIVHQGNNPQVYVTVPLFKTTQYTPYPNFEGEFDGVLLSIVEFQNLEKTYIQSLLDTQSRYLLVDLETNQTILRSPGMPNYLELTAQHPESGYGINEIDEVSGVGESIITSREIVLDNNRWSLVVVTPVKAAQEGISALQTKHLFTLAGLFGLILIVGVLLVYLYVEDKAVQERLEKANVTLEGLGITAGLEQERFTQAEMILKPHQVYLIKDDDENHAHELFIGSLNLGYAGLGIVREDPGTIMRKYGLKETSFIWMSTSKGSDFPTETRIDRLGALIEEFLSKTKKSVVLLDRFDYLISHSTAQAALAQISALKDLARSHESIIIVSLNPDAVDPRLMRSIEAETIDILGKELRRKTDLTPMESDILAFINIQNVQNRLVSFKDITAKFRITKPTTRAKVSRLQGIGLVQVEQRGRFKSLKVTSAGRRMLR